MDGAWLTPQWEQPARQTDILVTQPLHIGIPSWDYHYPRVTEDSLLLKKVPASSAQEEVQVSAAAVVEQDHCYLPAPIPQVQDSAELLQLPQAQSRQVQEMTTVTEDNEETTTAPEENDDDDEVTRDYSELIRILGGQPPESLPEVDVADVERLCEEFPSKVDAQPQASSENSQPQDSEQQELSAPAEPVKAQAQEAVPQVGQAPNPEPVATVTTDELPPQRELRSSQTRKSVLTKVFTKPATAKLESPFKGKTARQILAESAVEPTGPVKCSRNFLCQVDTHRSLGLFTEMHNSFPASFKLIVLYILTCAITYVENGVRFCVLCRTEQNNGERGTFFQLLQHSLTHGLMLVQCRTVEEVVRKLLALILGNKQFRWNCSFLNCSFTTKNSHLMYIHFVAVHRNLPTQLMLYCPYCLAQLTGDFVEHMSQPHPRHTFSCCNKEERMGFADYLLHFVNAHPRDLLSQLDQTTRVNLVSLWESKSIRLFWTTRVPIVTVNRRNIKLKDVFNRVTWKTPVDTVSKLINYITDLNELERIKTVVNTVPVPTVEHWRLLKHEILEQFIWKEFYPLIEKVAVLEISCTKNTDTMTRCEKRKFDNIQSTSSQSEPIRRKIQDTDEITSSLPIFRTKLHHGLKIRSPCGIILTTSLSTWMYTPDVTTKWLNLSINVEDDIETHLVNGVPHTETKDGELYKTDKSYFYRVHEALELCKWKDDVLILLDFPKFAHLDMEALFMKANAYARQAEQLINKYKDYHFIVMLPLPPKNKVQEEHISDHRIYIQKCSLIVAVLMQIKLIVIPLAGMVEREPHAMKHGRDFKTFKWNTAICDFPKSIEATRNVQNEPLPELRRRLGVLLDRLVSAKTSMLEEYNALGSATEVRYAHHKKLYSYEDYFNFGGYAKPDQEK